MLLFVDSKSTERSHIVAVCADNLSVSVPGSSERLLIQRMLLDVGNWLLMKTVIC